MGAKTTEHESEKSWKVMCEVHQKMTFLTVTSDNIWTHHYIPHTKRTA